MRQARDIPFNRPFTAAREEQYVREVLKSRRLAGGGEFTARCERLIAALVPESAAVILTHSASAALEMACLLIDLRPGDEVIMPSFTFASSANAVALRGAVPVFVDIRGDTLNLDETLVGAAVTDRTRAILPTHYAGVAADLETLSEVAAAHGLVIIEDAAHGIAASWRGRPLGTIGRFGALSFHDTKNIVAGEGGALLVNNPQDIEAAGILRDKGTNRSQFLRGLVDKYTWQEIGSSFMASELAAAVLLAQIEAVGEITQRRRAAWDHYHVRLAEAELAGWLLRPHIPEGCLHNAHIYWVLLPSATDRDRAIELLRRDGIQGAFHYAPLHDSPAGRRYGRAAGTLDVSVDRASRLLRLPLYAGLTATDQERVLRSLLAVLR